MFDLLWPWLPTLVLYAPVPAQRTKFLWQALTSCDGCEASAFEVSLSGADSCAMSSSQPLEEVARGNPKIVERTLLSKFSAEVIQHLQITIIKKGLEEDNQSYQEIQMSAHVCRPSLSPSDLPSPPTSHSRLAPAPCGACGMLGRRRPWPGCCELLPPRALAPAVHGQ